MQTYAGRQRQDWNMSDYVHDNLAVPLIYRPMGWSVTKASVQEDLSQGIDYFAEKNGKKCSIQERFRKRYKFTENSREFTIRYQRPNSHSSNQRNSEFFKIEADLLLYGIVNNEKFKESDGFLRYVIVNLRNLKEAIESGSILVDENQSGTRSFPYVSSGKPHAIVKKNHEDTAGNSTLLIFNVEHIYRNDSLRSIIFKQDGYL